MSLATGDYLGERVLVCGGRDFANYDWLAAVLDEFHSQPGIAVVIHGDAKGADALADKWAKDRRVGVIACPANWKVGRAAGPLRNAAMLRDHQPDLVIAFPGGRGTDDMASRSRRAGIPVVFPGAA